MPRRRVTSTGGERAGRRLAPPWLRQANAVIRRRRRRARRRHGGAGVLELLLGAGQRVEHLLAQTLAHRQGETAGDRHREDPAEEPAAGLLFARSLAQGHRRVAQRLGGIPDVLLELLIVEDRLRRRLAVGEPLDRAARRLVRLDDVVAQVIVFDDALDVRAVLRRLCGAVGTSGGAGGLLVRSRFHPSVVAVDCWLYSTFR